MPPTSRIEVDLTAVSGNVRCLRRALALGTERGAAAPGLCAVLKADGYALGAARIAKRLGIAGVDMIAVYTPDQARALVEAAITTPILVLMPVHDLDRSDLLYRSATRGQLHFTIHDDETFRRLAAVTDGLGLTLTVHLEVDTGMSRGGAAPAEATGLLRRIREHPRMKLAGVFNHFASADTDDAMTRRQSETFGAWLDACRDLLPAGCLVHEANTYGTFRRTAYHRTMIRVGLALLGYAGEEFGDPDRFELAQEAQSLTPAVRWLSQLVQIKSVEPGTPVGYGATWRAQRTTRLGLVPIGYADGYPIALSNRAKVGVELASGLRAFVPVVGRVSMDQVTIDLTDVPEGEVAVGSTVEVVGADRSAPNHLPALAKLAGTITHELLCRINSRLPRQYIAVEQGTPVIPAAVTGRAPLSGRLAV